MAIRAEDTKELQNWNELVKKNWDHWQYYKEMVNYSLQKSANSPITRFFYPFFYQERLLKRKFAENMQLLGDLTPDEALQYENYNSIMFSFDLYRYYKHPEGGFMKIISLPTVITAIFIGREAYIKKRPVRWWILAPLAFIAGVASLTQRHLIFKFSALVNQTQWTLEKRKAEVWRAQQFVEVPPLVEYNGLRAEVVQVVTEAKLMDLMKKGV